MEINIKTKTTVATAHVGVLSSVVPELVVAWSSPAMSVLFSLKHLEYLLLYLEILEVEELASIYILTHKRKRRLASWLLLSTCTVWPRGWEVRRPRPCFSYGIHYVFVHKKTWRSKEKKSWISILISLISTPQQITCLSILVMHVVNSCLLGFLLFMYADLSYIFFHS